MEKTGKGSYIKDARKTGGSLLAVERFALEMYSCFKIKGFAQHTMLQATTQFS